MPRPNGPQFQTFYHGTSESNAESILKKGLKVNNPAAELYGDDEEDYGHPTGVYVGENIDVARGYGDAVFEVKLPARHKNWGWTESEGAVWTKNIPPSRIKRVE